MAPLQLPDPRDKRVALLFAVAFYAAMAGAAWLLRAFTFGAGDSWNPTSDFAVPPLEPMLAGLAVVAVVLGITRPLARQEWSRRLTRLMQETFGRLTIPQAALIGVTSGVAEEYLFRGALQPWLGPIAATLIFALMHAIGRWWIFALVIGAALAALYHWSGNLWPCILVHVLINTVNLYRQSHWPLHGESLPAGTHGRD